jgi:glycine/D-amino acid oxidase-like deaminating enzyme
MKVLVLGAGVVGVTTAWFLSKSGHEVSVLERRDAAGMETSFANGGQISVSHAEPWANPAAPLKVLKWLAREDAPLLFRLRPDLRQWLWGLSFLRECTAARTRHNIRQIVTLGLYSRATLQALRAETGIAYDHLARGILHFYTSERELHAALEPAHRGAVSGRGRHGARAVLGRIAPGDALQRAVHRGHAVREPLPEHRARHARLDPRLRQRPGSGRHRLGPRAGNRLRVPA